MSDTSSSRLDVLCSSAEEFITRLRLTDPLWRKRSSNRWAFRGQANASWGLVPKAFRESTNLAYTGADVCPPLVPEQQRREELRALNHFLFLADRVGLPIPGDSQNLRLRMLFYHHRHLFAIGRGRVFLRLLPLHSTTAYRLDCSTFRMIH
jgi:hypothetical protein